MSQGKLRDNMRLGTQKLSDRVREKQRNGQQREGRRDDWSEKHYWQSGVAYNAEHMLQSRNHKYIC